MAVADLTAYLAGLGNPDRRSRYKSLAGTANAWPFLSSWKNVQDAGANPTAAVNNLDGASAGSLWPAIPASGTPRLVQVEGSISVPGIILLVDRLAHQAGLSGTATGAQTTNLPVGPSSLRSTTGDGVLAALEIYGQIGNTATTVTASYTNQAGTTGHTTPAIHIGASNDRDAGRFIPLPLQEGDTGVRAVASVTLAATTGTAGNFGVTLYKPLAMFGAGLRGQEFLWDAVNGGGGNMPDVTGIHPMLLYFYNGAVAGDGTFEFRFLDA